MYLDPSLIPDECYADGLITWVLAAPAKVDECSGAIPRMPKRLGPQRPHRPKMQSFSNCNAYAALVARLVEKEEIVA